MTSAAIYTIAFQLEIFFLFILSKYRKVVFKSRTCLEAALSPNSSGTLAALE